MSTAASTPVRPHVVVIGCGFAGLEAVRTLAKAPVDVTLIDRTNHHLFQPLLYQVATAGLSAPAISAPIRHILRRQITDGHLTVLQGQVAFIDVPSKNITLHDGEAVAYDHLIVAAGATHSYFGRDEWATHAPGLKTLTDALRIRSSVIGAYENAERCSDPTEREAWLTSVVIGGGPTGVEMAGTMTEIAQHTLADEFRRIDTRTARVVLLEGSDRVLGTFVPELSAKAQAQLIRLGVDVRTGCRVTDIDESAVTYQTRSSPDSEPQTHRLPARTVVWAAGVAASPLSTSLASTGGATLDRAGRVTVAPDLSLPGHPDVFVVGDLAAARSHGPGEPKPVPGVSPAAKQMGRAAAQNLMRQLRGETTQPFRYLDYGSLATVGRRAAVVDLSVPVFGAIRFSGLAAWLFWLFAHVYFLIGFRNRLMVLTDWAWAYVTFQRTARVVAEPAGASGVNEAPGSPSASPTEGANGADSPGRPASRSGQRMPLPATQATGSTPASLR